MTRRSGKGLGLTVRVSHEATRLSQAHVASAFERLVPILERQTGVSKTWGSLLALGGLIGVADA